MSLPCRLTFPSDVDAPPEFVELVRGMLHKDPEQRLDLHALRVRGMRCACNAGVCLGWVAAPLRCWR